MIIGIVTQNVGFNDGQGRVNYEIAEEALRRGYEVVLFCERAGSEMTGHGKIVVELMPTPSWLPSQMIKDQVFAWRSQRRIRATARSGYRGNARFDALLTNGAVTWKSADVNAVHFVHSTWKESPYHPWRQRRTATSLYKYLYNWLNSGFERDAFRRSGAVVAVSNMVCRELIDIGVPASTITTIPNGVDPEQFRPGQANRLAFGLPYDAVIALFAGDLMDSRKNLDTVLRALAHVPTLHLAVAGRSERTPWPRLALQLGVADRVHFLGFQNDMPELMRSVDLFVFPSRYETFGLVLLEALASGLPVITARTAGAAELLSPDVGVVLDNSDDTPALSSALRSMVDSSERRQLMGAAARALAMKHSWRNAAACYVTLLENAARNRPLPEVVTARTHGA